MYYKVVATSNNDTFTSKQETLEQVFNEVVSLSRQLKLHDVEEFEWDKIEVFEVSEKKIS